MLDLLVRLGIFRSRSEVAAAIIEKTLFEQKDTFELLNSQIAKLEEIQDEAKTIAQNVFK
jgi:Arc/MetJ-type ribon-helix-helix transcriptional regulator